MGMEFSDDVIETMWKREDYLEFLANDGNQKTREEIAEEFDRSDSTIYKRIKELEQNGLIKEAENVVTITVFGKTVLKRYRDLRKICEFKDLLGEISSEVEIDPEILEKGELILPENHAPHKPLKYLENIVRGHNEIQVISPFMVPKYVEFFYDPIIDGELDIEVILTEEVVRYVFSEYHRKFTTALEYDNLTINKIHDQLPFGIFICGDQEICLMVYESGNGIKGLVHCKSDESVNWAKKLFQKYREKSEKVYLRIPPYSNLDIWKN